MLTSSQSLCCIVLVILSPMLSAVVVSGYLTQPSDSPLTLTLNPSNAVIKVGEKERINITLTASATEGSQVCFSVEGFPSSGFIISMRPECVQLQANVTAAVLIVEVTPAAAPQRFTALVVVKAGSQTLETPLNITVQPGISPAIPWLLILLFVGVFVMLLKIEKDDVKRLRRQLVRRFRRLEKRFAH